MKKIIREEKIEYAILTVSSEEAQGMTNDLVDCGIRGIVNYTPRVLKVPPKVSVENVSLLTALEILAI
jgi:redox-sensing transcriptional repressor